MHFTTEIDPQTSALFARNPYNSDFEDRVAFLDASEPRAPSPPTAPNFSAQRHAWRNPPRCAASRLSGKVGAGLDPCAALQVQMEFGTGQEREIVFILGAGQNVEQARDLARRFQNLRACREELEKVWTIGATRWRRQRGHARSALNLLANGWLLYQTISCRLWARTGFINPGARSVFATSFRMRWRWSMPNPELLREQLLRAAAHQFREGDVQHWWHPPLGRGVRTHFSDDFLWLACATCRYVETYRRHRRARRKHSFPRSPRDQAGRRSVLRSAQSLRRIRHALRTLRARDQKRS